MRALALAALVLAAAPARAGGCDVDSLPGIACCFMEGCLVDGAEQVGGARELRKRVAKAGYRAMVISLEGKPTKLVRFDERGRYVSQLDSALTTYGWDDADRLTLIKLPKSEKPIAGGDGWCTVSKTTCTLKGAEFTMASTGYAPQNFTVAGSQVTDPKTQRLVFALDAEGRVTKAAMRAYKYEPAQTTVTREYYENSPSVEAWKLSAEGLPESYAKTTFQWFKTSSVKVVDGTCAKGKPCKNPQVESLIAALSDDKRLTVSSGDPAKNVRTASEVWYRGLNRDLADELAKKLAISGDPKEWTWNGDFDVQIVAGPPAAK